MQEWNLQGASRRSAVSDRPFSDGQQVRSVLCLSGEEGLIRLDFGLDEPLDLGEARPVAQWVRTYRSNEAEKAGEREAVRTVEELFVQMVEDEQGADDPARSADSATARIRDALRFLLALHLERKRVLRPLGRIGEDGSQTYRHPKRDTEYRVPAVVVEEDLRHSLEEQLSLVVG